MIVESAGGRAIVGQADFFDRFGEAFLREANAFIAAVRDGASTPLTLAAAREATPLACAVRDALKVG